MADEPLVDELVAAYAWDTPLRVAAGLHYLVLGGRAAWDDVQGALVEHRDFLRRFVAEQGVQTNEVQRSWMLLPCFLEAARAAGAEALDLIELGSSAGLNLVWDRYRYLYAAGAWGSGTLELDGEERRHVPAELLRLAPRVRSRVGVDRAPIDVTSDEGARLLKAFVWPDQTWRLELLVRAIAAVREDPPMLVRADIVERLPQLLERRRPNGLTVVFQTAVLGYLESEDRTRVRESLERAGAAGPLAFVSAGRPADGDRTHFGMILQLWPGGERRVVAHGDFHGAWIDWLG